MPEPPDLTHAVTWDERVQVPFCYALSGYDPLRVQNADRGRW